MNDFKRSEELYQLDWSKSGGTVTVGEIDILLPKMPSEKRMVNYELPTKKQKFVKRPVPAMRDWSDTEKLEYADAEWHRRWNGYWILIKGEPYYVPGNADLYFNHWWAEFGGIPEFRFTQLQFWWWWWHIERDPNSFGGIVYKSRRDGLTEVSLCASWDRATKWSGNKNLVIHIDKEGALDNFTRIMEANIRMPWFYRPINSGSVRSKSGKINFEKEGGKVTKEMLESGDFFLESDYGLGSSIGVLAAVTGAGDGRRYFTYYSDEIFKVESSKFDIKKQWGIIKPTMAVNNDVNIIGKTIKTSTVEEMKSSDTVALAREFWNDSNPSDRMTGGRTVTGLYRYFRDYTHGAEIDEYGFPKAEEARVVREATIADLRARKKFDEIQSIKRKQPATIEEALSVSSEKCILYPELCDERLKMLESGIDREGKFTPRGVGGTLSWKNGVFMGEVEWNPNPNGKWFFSQQPAFPNNAIRVPVTESNPWGIIPANTGTHRMGIDPYDSVGTQEKGSDGAFSVKRKMDEAAEQFKFIRDDKGFITNTDRMVTGQFVCDYKCRPESPYTFYEDCLLTMRYFGVHCFPERNKDGFYTWLVSKGLEQWVQVQPPQIRSNPKEKNPIRGANATDKIVELYVSQLQLHIHQFVWNCHHPRILKQWMEFIVENRTKFDLAVATGFTEIACLDERYVDEKKDSGWSKRPGNRYYEK